MVNGQTVSSTQASDQEVKQVQDQVIVAADTDGHGPVATIADGTSMDLSQMLPGSLGKLLQPSHNSFEQMVAERRIRVLVTYNRTNFFLDRVVPVA